MQVLLKSDTIFENLGVAVMKSKNNYGTMYNIKPKLDLMSNEFVGEYFVFDGLNNKTFLAINSNSEMAVALKKIEQAVSKENDSFTFKAGKEKLYIRIPDDMPKNIPKNHNLKIAVNVYGVFVQNGSKTAFLQFELLGYKVYPRVDFDNVVSQ